MEYWQYCHHVAKNGLRILVSGVLLLLMACAANQNYIEGTRTIKSIQAAFDQSKYDIYRVYSEALEQNPGLLGKTIFRVTVSADGDVVQSTVVESTLNDTRITSAVNQIIYRMNFGRVRQTGNVTFTYPIDFIPR